jgi:hypothetical protein
MRFSSSNWSLQPAAIPSDGGPGEAIKPFETTGRLGEQAGRTASEHRASLTAMWETPQLLSREGRRLWRPLKKGVGSQ